MYIRIQCTKLQWRHYSLFVHCDIEHCLIHFCYLRFLPHSPWYDFVLKYVPSIFILCLGTTSGLWSLGYPKESSQSLRESNFLTLWLFHNNSLYENTYLGCNKAKFRDFTLLFSYKENNFTFSGLEEFVKRLGVCEVIVTFLHGHDCIHPLTMTQGFSLLTGTLTFAWKRKVYYAFVCFLIRYRFKSIPILEYKNNKSKSSGNRI